MAGDFWVIDPPRHDQRAAKPAVAPAVVVAPKALYLEPGAGIQRDRPGVVEPDLERDLVGAARAGVVLDGREQRSPAAAATKVGEDRHPDRQDPRGRLLDRRMPNLAAVVVLQHKEPRRLPALDDVTEPLDPLLDVDRRLRTQEPLGGDGGHGSCLVSDTADT